MELINIWGSRILLFIFKLVLILVSIFFLLGGIRTVYTFWGGGGNQINFSSLNAYQVLGNLSFTPQIITLILATQKRAASVVRNLMTTLHELIPLVTEKELAVCVDVFSATTLEPTNFYLSALSRRDGQWKKVPSPQKTFPWLTF